MSLEPIWPSTRLLRSRKSWAHILHPRFTQNCHSDTDRDAVPSTCSFMGCRHFSCKRKERFNRFVKEMKGNEGICNVFPRQRKQTFAFKYHTLADVPLREPYFHRNFYLLPVMTKEEILAIYSRSDGFLSPDEVRANLRPSPNRRSFYSYLLRLARQGLLERRSAGRGSLAYRLTERGRARLSYLRNRRR